MRATQFGIITIVDDNNINNADIGGVAIPLDVDFFIPIHKRE